jgi:hypothetical protein
MVHGCNFVKGGSRRLCICEERDVGIHFRLQMMADVVAVNGETGSLVVGGRGDTLNVTTEKN